LDVESVVLQDVTAGEKNFVDGVVVVEFDETEAAFLAGALLDHLFDVGNGSVGAKVFFDVVVFYALFKSTDKDLLHGLLVVRTFAYLFSGSSSLGLNFRAVNHVRSLLLDLIYHRGASVSDKSEPSRTLRVSELHDYTVN